MRLMMASVDLFLLAALSTGSFAAEIRFFAGDHGG
jgi:hypothetical protein